MEKFIWLLENFWCDTKNKETRHGCDTMPGLNWGEPIENLSHDHGSPLWRSPEGLSRAIRR